MSRVGALYNVQNNQTEEILQRTVAGLVYDNQRQQYLNTTLNGLENRINLVDAKTTIATTQQAQQGVNDTALMTPLKTAQAIRQGGTFQGNIKIENAAPILEFSGTDQVGRYFLTNDLGRFSLRKDSLDNQNYPFLVESDGRVIVDGVNIQELFQSVSNGKSQVAAAITGKGVTTAADASFQTLATNINAIQVGQKVARGTVFSSASTLPMFSMNGTSINLPRVVVSGLDFVPRYILLTDERSSTAITSQTVYNADLSNTFSGAILSSHNRSGVTNQGYNVNPNSTNTYVNGTGFALPVENTSIMIDWVAIQ